MCHSMLLANKGKTTISFCNRCYGYYVWQDSFLLTFNKEQYSIFLDQIKAKLGKEEYFTFPNGEPRTILSTPVQEIVFTFNAEEWFDFTETLFEAGYMREVYQLFRQENKS